MRHRVQRDGRSRGRAGVALALVLWVLTGVAALVLVSMRTAVDAATVAEHRIALLRSSWHAEECTERARAAVDRALAADVSAGGTGATWRTLDSVVARAPELEEAVGCTATLQPTGVALDLTSADIVQLRGVLGAVGIPPPLADSLADALLDWQDADDEPRPAGAEAASYAAVGGRPPRNAPITDVAELRRIRGFDALAPSVAAALLAAVTTEPGRISLPHANTDALASLPGMTPEVRSLVRELQTSGALRDGRVGSTPAAALDLLISDARLPAAARDSLAASRQELAMRMGMEPEAWILVARGLATQEGPSRSTASVELRLVRAGERAAVVRRRLQR